jgi:hypothetical protein
MSFRQFLNEMLSVGEKTPKEDDTIIAYNKWVWIVNDYTFDIHKENILKTLKIKEDGIHELYDLKTSLREYNSDIIVGTYSRRALSLDSSDWRHSTGSKLLLKTMKLLKLHKVEVPYYDESQGDTEYFEDDREDMLTPMAKKTFYHGTSAKQAQGIIKKGILPSGGEGITNFEKIAHAEKVFITLNLEKAYFHANTAARLNNDFPVIIEIKLPDVNKLVLDYDVAMAFYGIDNQETIDLGYDDIHQYATGGGNNYQLQMNVVDRMKKVKTDLSTQLGVFGYQGRIPPSHIYKIIFDEDALERYVYGQETDYYEYDEARQEISELGDWIEVKAEKFKGVIDDHIETIQQEYEDDEDYE